MKHSLLASLPFVLAALLLAGCAYSAVETEFNDEMAAKAGMAAVLLHEFARYELARLPDTAAWAEIRQKLRCVLTLAEDLDAMARGLYERTHGVPLTPMEAMRLIRKYKKEIEERVPSPTSRPVGPAPLRGKPAAEQ